jgi:hypothetical protein
VAVLISCLPSPLLPQQHTHRLLRHDRIPAQNNGATSTTGMRVHWWGTLVALVADNALLRAARVLGPTAFGVSIERSDFEDAGCKKLFSNWDQDRHGTIYNFSDSQEIIFSVGIGNQIHHICHKRRRLFRA